MNASLASEHRFARVAGYDEAFLSVDSSRLDEDIQFIVNNRVQNIILCGRKNYHLSNIDRLRDVRDILRWIVITPPRQGEFSLTGLMECKHLTHLKLNVEAGHHVDLSPNRHLNQLDLSNCTNINGFEALTELESLVLSNASSLSLRAFPSIAC